MAQGYIYKFNILRGGVLREMDVVEFPKSRSTKIEGNKGRHVKETWRRHPVGWSKTAGVCLDGEKGGGMGVLLPL